jgi:hypothetical protein
MRVKRWAASAPTKCFSGRRLFQTDTAAQIQTNSNIKVNFMKKLIAATEFGTTTLLANATAPNRTKIF